MTLFIHRAVSMPGASNGDTILDRLAVRGTDGSEFTLLTGRALHGLTLLVERRVIFRAFAGVHITGLLGGMTFVGFARAQGAGKITQDRHRIADITRIAAQSIAGIRFCHDILA